MEGDEGEQKKTKKLNTNVSTGELWSEFHRFPMV